MSNISTLLSELLKNKDKLKKDVFLLYKDKLAEVEKYINQLKDKNIDSVSKVSILRDTIVEYNSLIKQINTISASLLPGAELNIQKPQLSTDVASATKLLSENIGLLKTTNIVDTIYKVYNVNKAIKVSQELENPISRDRNVHQQENRRRRSEQFTSREFERFRTDNRSREDRRQEDRQRSDQRQEDRRQEDRRQYEPPNVSEYPVGQIEQILQKKELESPWEPPISIMTEDLRSPWEPSPTNVNPVQSTWGPSPTNVNPVQSPWEPSPTNVNPVQSIFNIAPTPYSNFSSLSFENNTADRTRLVKETASELVGVTNIIQYLTEDASRIENVSIVSEQIKANVKENAETLVSQGYVTAQAKNVSNQSPAPTPGRAVFFTLAAPIAPPVPGVPLARRSFRSAAVPRLGVRRAVPPASVASVPAALSGIIKTVSNTPIPKPPSYFSSATSMYSTPQMSAEEKEKLRLEAIRMTNPLITVSLQDIEDQKTAALELIKPIEQVFTIHKSYVKLYETLSKLINDTLKEFKDIAAIDPTSGNLKAISILYDNRVAIDAIADIDPATILAKYTTTVTDLETKYKVIDKIAKGCASEITAFDTRIKKNATDHAHGDEPMINAAIADQSAIPADITTYVTNVKTYLIGTDFDNLIDSFDVMIGEYKGNLDAMSYYMINLFDEVYTIGDNNLKDSIENATTECSDYFTELSKYGSHYTTFENKTNMSNLYAKFYDIANFDVTISGKKEKLSAIAQDLTTKFGSKGITYPYKNDTVGSNVTNYKTKVIDEIDKLKTKADTCLTAVVVDPKSSKDHKDAMKLFTDKAKCIHGYIQAVETIVTTLCYPAANAAVHLDMLRDVDKYNMEHKLILDTIIADTAIITKGVTEFETTRVELAKLETELDKVKPEVKIKFENECIKLTKLIQTNLVEGVLTEVKYKVGDGTNESQLNSSIDTTEKEYTESVNVAIAAAKNEDLKRGGTTEQDALNAELTSLDIPKNIRDLSKAVVELCEIVMLDSKTIAINGVTIKPRESYLKYQTVISYCIKNTKVESPVKDITNAVTEVSDYIADVGKEITDLSNYITDNIAKLNPLVTDISKKLPNLVKSGSPGEKYFTGTSIEAKYSSSAQAKVVADLKTIYGDVTSRYVNVRSTECVLNYYNATNMSTLYSLANDGKNGIYSTYLNKIEATLTSKIKIPSADVQKTDIYKQYAQLISNLSQIFNLADLIKYIDSYLHFESLVDNYNAKKDASTGNYTGSDASVLLSKFTTAVNDWINSVPATTDVCLSNLPSVIGEVTNMNIILDDLLSSKDAELSLVDSKGASLVYIGSSDQIKTYSMDEYNKQFGIIQTRYVDVYTNNMAKFTSLKPVLINFYKKEDAGFGKAIVDYNKTVKALADSVNPICNYLDTKSIKYNGGTFIKALNDLKDNALAVVDNKASGNITIAEALPGFQIVNKLINNVDHYTNSTIDYLAEYEVEFNTVISHVGKFKDADFTNNQFDDRLVELQNAHTNQSKLSKDANAWIKQLNDDIDQTASPKFKFKELEDAAKVAAIGYWQKQIQKENWGNLETAVTGIDVDAYGLGCITAVIGDIVANSSELAKYTNVLDLDGKFHGSAVDNKFPDYKKVTDDVSKFKLAYSGYIILSKSTYKDLLELDDSDLSKYTKSLTDYTRLLNDYNRGSADPKSPEGLVTELLTKVNFTDSDTTKNSIIGYLLEYDSKTLSNTIVSAIIDAEADADAAAKKAAATKRVAEEAAEVEKVKEEEEVKQFTKDVNTAIAITMPAISDAITENNKNALNDSIKMLKGNLKTLEDLTPKEDKLIKALQSVSYSKNKDLENKLSEVTNYIKKLENELVKVDKCLKILSAVNTEYNKVTGSNEVKIPGSDELVDAKNDVDSYEPIKTVLKHGIKCVEVVANLEAYLKEYFSIKGSDTYYKGIENKIIHINATIREVNRFYSSVCVSKLGMNNSSKLDFNGMLAEVEFVEKSKSATGISNEYKEYVVRLIDIYNDKYKTVKKSTKKGKSILLNPEYMKKCTFGYLISTILKHSNGEVPSGKVMVYVSKLNATYAVNFNQDVISSIISYKDLTEDELTVLDDIPDSIPQEIRSITDIPWDKILPISAPASVSMSTPPPAPTGGPSTPVVSASLSSKENIAELKKYIEDMFKAVEATHPIRKPSTFSIGNPYTELQFRQRYKYLKYIQLYVSYMQKLDSTYLSTKIDKLIKDMNDANSGGFLSSGYDIEDIEEYYDSGFVITKKPDGFRKTVDSDGVLINDDISIPESKNNLVQGISNINNHFMEINIDKQNGEKLIGTPEKYLEYLLKEQVNYKKIQELKNNIGTIGYMDSTNLLEKAISTNNKLVEDYTEINDNLEKDKKQIEEYHTQYAININISLGDPDLISQNLVDLNKNFKIINSLSYSSVYKSKSKSTAIEYSNGKLFTDTKNIIADEHSKCLTYLNTVRDLNKDLNSAIESYSNALSEIDNYLSNEHDKNDLTVLVSNADRSADTIINTVTKLNSSISKSPKGITITFDPKNYTYASKQYNISETELNKSKVDISWLINDYRDICKEIDDLLSKDTKDINSKIADVEKALEELDLIKKQELVVQKKFYRIKYKTKDINSKIADVEKALKDLKTTEDNKKVLLNEKYYSYSDLIKPPIDSIDNLKDALGRLKIYYNNAHSIFKSDSTLGEEYKNEKTVTIKNGEVITNIELSVQIAKDVVESLDKNIEAVNKFNDKVKKLMSTQMSNNDKDANNSLKQELTDLLNTDLKFDKNITNETPKIVDLMGESVFKEPINIYIKKIDEENSKIASVVAASVAPVVGAPLSSEKKDPSSGAGAAPSSPAASEVGAPPPPSSGVGLSESIYNEAIQLQTEYQNLIVDKNYVASNDIIDKINNCMDKFRELNTAIEVAPLEIKSDSASIMIKAEVVSKIIDYNKKHILTFSSYKQTVDSILHSENKSDEYIKSLIPNVLKYTVLNNGISIIKPALDYRRDEIINYISNDGLNNMEYGGLYLCNKEYLPLLFKHDANDINSILYMILTNNDKVDFTYYEFSKCYDKKDKNDIEDYSCQLDMYYLFIDILEYSLSSLRDSIQVIEKIKNYSDIPMFNKYVTDQTEWVNKAQNLINKVNTVRNTSLDAVSNIYNEITKLDYKTSSIDEFIKAIKDYHNIVNLGKDYQVEFTKEDADLLYNDYTALYFIKKLISSKLYTYGYQHLLSESTICVYMHIIYVCHSYLTSPDLSSDNKSNKYKEIFTFIKKKFKPINVINQSKYLEDIFIGMTDTSTNIDGIYSNIQNQHLKFPLDLVDICLYIYDKASISDYNIEKGFYNIYTHIDNYFRYYLDIGDTLIKDIMSNIVKRLNLNKNNLESINSFLHNSLKIGPFSDFDSVIGYVNNLYIEEITKYKNLYNLEYNKVDYLLQNSITLEQIFSNPKEEQLMYKVHEYLVNNKEKYEEFSVIKDAIDKYGLDLDSFFKESALYQSAYKKYLAIDLTTLLNGMCKKYKMPTYNITNRYEFLTKLNTTSELLKETDAFSIKLNTTSDSIRACIYNWINYGIVFNFNEITELYRLFNADVPKHNTSSEIYDTLISIIKKYLNNRINYTYKDNYIYYLYEYLKDCLAYSYIDNLYPNELITQELVELQISNTEKYKVIEACDNLTKNLEKCKTIYKTNSIYTDEIKTLENTPIISYPKTNIYYVADYYRFIKNDSKTTPVSGIPSTSVTGGGYLSYAFNPFFIITVAVITLLVILFIYLINKKRKNASSQRLLTSAVPPPIQYIEYY